MATEEGRSLNNGGISIPQWMKSKITETRFDFEESAFSPPENDSNFFYIRYPQVEKKIKSPIANRKNSNSSIGICEVDYINHTAPCKQYITNPGYKPKAALPKLADAKIKSNGTDDGFKGEGAACGSSVIRVAHQMVAGRYPLNTSSSDEDPLKPKTFDPMKRRGSKSLPVTPISSPQNSPKTKRRLANKYFTGPFVDNENHGGNWILQGLLSRRDISQSIGYIAEENIRPDIEKTFSDLHINEPKPERKIKREFKPAQCEFREMNFWSPTSM